MKRKDIKNLHTKSVAELKKQLGEVEAEVAKMMLERSVKGQKNSRITNTLKDDIARIYTVMQEVKNKGVKKA